MTLLEAYELYPECVKFSETGGVEYDSPLRTFSVTLFKTEFGNQAVGLLLAVGEVYRIIADAHMGQFQ